ncbi:MAG: class I adenylate-forming enzyme family protein [Solirubrobacterales bacterium]
MSGSQRERGAHRGRRTPATLLGWLREVTHAQGSRPAVGDGTETWSYHRLWDAAGRVAQGLRRDGAAAAPAVALIGTNSPAYLAAYLGVMRSGSMVVPLNHRNSLADLRQQLELVGADLCVAAGADDGLLAGLGEACSVLDAGRLLETEPVVDIPEPDADDPALCVLTSGSTGAPKGVVHSQGTLLHAGLQLLGALPINRDDVGLAFLPFFASAPEHALPLLLGGAALRTTVGFDPDEICDACDEVTSFDAVPTAIGRLLELGNHAQLRKLKWISFASEPMPATLLERWREEVPTVAAHQFYGLTELLPATHADPVMMREASGTVGTPYPTTALRIVDEELDEVGIGEEGEVVCWSPARMSGYLDAPAQTAEALTDDGALRTGDIGHLDERGRLFLTGRRKELIISGGLNVSPAEIEAAAYRCPGVAAAAVIGMPDSRWGETPVLIAVASRGESLSATDLLRHCEGELAGYKRPSAAAVLPDLPVIGIGKSAKAVLRERIMRGELTLVHRNGMGDAAGQDPEGAVNEPGTTPRRS